MRSCHRRPYPTATVDKHEVLWMSPFGAVRGVLMRGRGGGSISFVHDSRKSHSGVVADPLILGHDAAVLGTFFTDVSEMTELRSKHRKPVYGVVS